jgi:Tol biopolymer transport system component/DNA-binding winged helix-turn-helix (wHTH) protein
MTDKYYLINDHIKFKYDIEEQSISFANETQSLEPKEAQILKYILENNQDGLIRSENILDNNWDFWSDKKVLQKVLSTLRKKFKQIGVSENGFVAAGSSYKINYTGVLVVAQEQQLKQQNALKAKILQSVKTAVIWALIGAVSLMSIIKFNEVPRITVDNIIQATAISGVSVEPALSPDGNALAFAHKKENKSEIYLKVDNNLNFKVLTTDHYDQVPVWSPSGRKIAFQRKEKGLCEIRMIELDESLSKIGKDKKIAQCNQFTFLARITWSSETSLYFTDRRFSKGPLEIKQLDLNTSKVSPYFSYDTTPTGGSYSGSGHYFIVYNTKLKALFSLESPDWVVSNIKRVHADNTATKIHTVGDVILSIDIYDNHLIYKDLDNQLKSFSLDNTKEMIRIYKNPLKPIGYPAVSANNNKIAIVSGSIFRNNLYAMDIQSEDISEVFASQFTLTHPQQVDNEILYVSRETGLFQIYAYSNNIQTQLTNFTKNKRIVHFTLSNNKQWLAINFFDGTKLYKRHINGLTEIKFFPLMSFPAFSLNSDRILLKNLVKVEQDSQPQWVEELVEFNLTDYTETGISIKNASFGSYHEKGIIYVSASHVENAIYLFTLNDVETIYKGKVPRQPSLFAVTEEYMILSSYKNATKIDLTTKESVQLPERIKGQITASNERIYFKSQLFGNMVIFKGELNKN